MVDCDCGDKQFLIFGEDGILYCTNCGAEETEDLDYFVKDREVAQK